MLIGRENEKKILLKLQDSDESGFAAVYGRRRVGKTYLIRETFNGHFTFMHTGYARGNLQEQLFAFSASLREYGFADFEKPANWMEAFELLKDLIRSSTDQKKIIFLDELSWMDSGRSDLLTALEGFWNGWASARKDIVLIVCGSVTTWIMDKIIHNKGGLHNRLSAEIHLGPFSLGECEDYIKSRGILMNRHQVLECYMIMGGIPFYWSLLQKGYSLPQNIDRIFFSRYAQLRDEYKYVYASLFKNPGEYMNIVSALARKQKGLTREELLDETASENSGAFTKKLEDLEACGFIRKYTEFGKKAKNSRYQLIDNFTLFYLKFMSPRPTDEHYWENRTDSAAVNAWCGLAFERVCLEHVGQIKAALGISGVLTNECSWSCKSEPDKGIAGSQIDLLIVRKDQIINLCEMKYSEREYTVTARTDADIRNKTADLAAVTNTKYAIHPILVTTYGVKTNSYSGNLQAVITAEDLFRK